MSEAWAICPRCGKTIAVETVAWPGEPVALAKHRKDHEGDSGAAAATEKVSAEARPSGPPMAPAPADAPPRTRAPEKANPRARRSPA